jgi:hypothetical protein
MSDKLDAIAKAMSLNKKLAARLLVRKEALAAAGDTTSEDWALVQEQLTATLAEIKSLQKLGAAHKGDTASVSELSDDDPLTPSVEQAALQRARDGIQALDAQAGLGTESAPVVKPTQADADEKARQEFEALRGNPGAKLKRTM